MFCHITKDVLNVMKIVIINALPKLQLLPFCFVGQYRYQALLYNTFYDIDSISLTEKIY